MWIFLCFSQKISSYQGGQGQNYSSYNQSQSSYYGSNNSVAQGGYYSQWGGYDQYSGYNSSYNSTYNTGYNTGYNSGYNYNYGYGYPPPGHMPPPPIGMPPTSTDMPGAVEVREKRLLQSLTFVQVLSENSYYLMSFLAEPWRNWGRRRGDRWRYKQICSSQWTEYPWVGNKRHF